MRLVAQQDNFGCGVACAASILELNYKETLLLFEDGKNKAKERGFYCKEIIKALKQKCLAYEYKYVKPHLHRKIYIPEAIVFLRRSKKYHVGHYLLRIKNGWMDPWGNFPNENKKAQFRKRLPEKPIYAIFEVKTIP